MKHIIFYFVLAFFTPTVSLAQVSEKDQVKKTFDHYKSAILNDEAEAALKTIDLKTRNYYTDILKTVKTADSTQIASRSLVDKITVLGIRARANKEEILKMQGTDAFLFAIRNGMVGKNSVSNNSVGEITIDKNFAKGELVVQGNKTPVFFHFYKEEDGWKLNLTELFALSNMALKNMLKDSELPEDQAILQLVGVAAGKELTTEIFKPLE